MLLGQLAKLTGLFLGQAECQTYSKAVHFLFLVGFGFGFGAGNRRRKLWIFTSANEKTKGEESTERNPRVGPVPDSKNIANVILTTRQTNHYFGQFFSFVFVLTCFQASILN